MLGAIPPLVGMLDSSDIDLQISALYALLILGIINDLPEQCLIESGSSLSVSEAIIANFLGLTTLDSNKPIIGSSGAIPFLVGAFKNPSATARGGGSSQARHDAFMHCSTSPLPLLPHRRHHRPLPPGGSQRHGASSSQMLSHHYDPSEGQETSVGFPLGQWVPKIAINAYVAPNVVLVGEVTIYDGASILHGELNKITIGFYSKVLHAAWSSPTGTPISQSIPLWFVV
ncbi:hypothetical protein COCNU_scaffold003335G000010 [Cocos nucifera]|nr:hypothetical protein [Cocos nucifera]